MREPDLGPSEDFDPPLLRLALEAHRAESRHLPHSEAGEDALLERLLDGLDRYAAASPEDHEALLVSDPDLRAAFCDVAAAEAELAAEPVAARRVLAERHTHLRSAAIDAFSRTQLTTTAAPPQSNGQVATPAARTSERVLQAHRPRPSLLAFAFTRAAAAVLLVGFGVAIVALSGILRERALDDEGPRAEAGLQLTSVAHYRRGGKDTGSPAVNVSSEREPFVTVGQRFAPAAGQVIVFGLGHASHLVLGEGDQLHVASGEQLDPRLMARAAQDLEDAGNGGDLAALLRLEAGEAKLDARAGRPVLLAVDGDGLLVLWNGACHVAISTDAPAIALSEGSRARFYRLRGEDVQGLELAGPSRMLLTADGAKDDGAPADALFRDLQLFGGDLVPGGRDVEYRVAATLWRRLGGNATRRSGRFFVPLGGAEGDPARLAFEPVPSLRSARALRVALRAPAGTRVSLRSRIAARDPARVLAVEGILGRDTRDEDPGIAQITLDLPADWFARLAGGELVLVVSAAEAAGDETARDGAPTAGKRMEAVFDGVAFVFATGGGVPSGGGAR